MRPIQQNLPLECQALEIQPRHRVAFEHFFVGNDVYVVLLTNMPGQADKVWKLTRKEYWALQTKHESRDRYIRAWHTPILVGEENPQPIVHNIEMPTLFA